MGVEYNTSPHNNTHDMDEIRREALNDYQQRTKEQKQRVLNIFKAMDTDGNGSISIQEFVKSLQQKGLYRDHLYGLFTQLQTDNSGTLNFEAIITLKFMVDHDKYRNRLVATFSNVNTHKHRGGEPDLVEKLNGFIDGFNLGSNIAEAATTVAEDGCSIM
ncbi:hypothetical protein EUGRSUZ_G01601 [Eucalyptus grandis]|uniref:Uncharacterized protein n=2 Tax=Eucalyptus grandis TaxID=71139 RepID=A0ACC3K3Y0_EUCGR|nr:hypothetical protein EUGRSUZ_G01601 [Eucalyptus grandis]